MQFPLLLSLRLLALFAVVAITPCASATPLPTQINNPTVAGGIKPPGWNVDTYEGKCNGKSCQFSGLLGIPTNVKCDHGKCVGRGGGDGTRCLATTSGSWCPVGCQGKRCAELLA
ncbi:hypothetical protein BJ170DRAFT_637609 [Xylariales sp. AK1849]|nr:hypothetical protein BJ170DRAFT_637609 [Xylariales sp. AK1849]